MLIDEGLNSGDYDMNLELNQSLQFGLTNDFTGAALEKIVNDYIRLGLITSTDDAAEVMKKAWHPLGDDSLGKTPEYRQPWFEKMAQ